MIGGISGASGAVYGPRLLEALRELDIESHLVFTSPGERTLAYETDHASRAVRAMADFCYSDGDIGATIASGSVLNSQQRHRAGLILATARCKSATKLEIAAR